MKLKHLFVIYNSMNNVVYSIYSSNANKIIFNYIVIVHNMHPEFATSINAALKNIKVLSNLIVFIGELSLYF